MEEKFSPLITRESFVKFCKLQVEQQHSGVTTIEDAAYNICGACNQFPGTLPEFSEVMDIACDLELPAEYRDRSKDDWEKLVTLIDRM